MKGKTYFVIIIVMYFNKLQVVNGLFQQGFDARQLAFLTLGQTTNRLRHSFSPIKKETTTRISCRELY